MDNQQGKTYQELIEMLAYVFGVYQGDGYYKYHYYGNGGWYMTEVSKGNKEVLENYQEIINNFFGTNYKLLSRKIKSGMVIWTLRTSKKVIYEVLNNATAFRTQVPYPIISGSRECKLEYIAGIFDTDGSVAENNGRHQLKFSSNELGIIQSVALILQKLGVKVGKIGTNEKGGYKTVYSIQPNLRSFHDAGCYFYNIKKAQRLQRYLDKVCLRDYVHCGHDNG